MLIFCAPSGFDRFQMEGGTVVDGSKGPFLPPSNDDRERIRNAAARHGVELAPSPAAFNEAGRVTFRGKDEGLVIDTVGDRYRFLVTGEDTGGKYALWEALIGPNGGPPPHVHSREEEGFYVLEGELTFYTEDRSFSAGPGTLVNLPKNSLHWFRNETDTRVRALIFVAPAGFEQMFLETGTRIGSWSDPLSPPDPEEKGRILEAAPKYGVEIRLPTKDR
jgi:quercetin dioxygenase-like cupin family protein